jgi:hypothetical protein
MGDLWLRLAYGFNILILAPVLIGLYAHRGAGPIAVMGGGIQNDDGLRLLVASLWLAVMLLSIAGLVNPKPFVALLVFQVVYKAIYLGSYVGPSFLRVGWDAVPAGPAAVFAIIVIAYPFIIWKVWAA